MSTNNDNIFENIQQKANINKETIFKIADSVKDANFKDETTVRQLIKQIALLSGKPVPKEKEDAIVKAIITNNMPINLSSISGMFKK